MAHVPIQSLGSDVSAWVVLHQANNSNSLSHHPSDSSLQYPRLLISRISQSRSCLVYTMADPRQRVLATTTRCRLGLGRHLSEQRSITHLQRTLQGLPGFAATKPSRQLLAIKASSQRRPNYLPRLHVRQLNVKHLRRGVLNLRRLPGVQRDYRGTTMSTLRTVTHPMTTSPPSTSIPCTTTTSLIYPVHMFLRI